LNPLISIVVPVYNEERLIDRLYERIISALLLFTENFEVIVVNDGSRDKTEENLLQCHKKDSRFKVLSLSRNFGHQAAVWAGLEYSTGDFIGIMDGDLQDPPEMFEKFFQKINEGFDVVYAVRKKRKENFIKKVGYKLFYKILSFSSKIHIPLDSGDFSLISRQVLDQIIQLRERNPFIRGIRSWVGFKQYGFAYDRDARDSGKVKYTLKKLIRLALDGFFGFSDYPIRFLGRLGLLIILGSLGYSTYILIKFFFMGSVPQGFTTIILAILFFGGIQLFSIRIIGEYVLRIFDESRKRPIYIVKSFTGENNKQNN